MDYQGTGGRGCFNCRSWPAFYLLPSFVSPQPCTISTRLIAFVGFPLQGAWQGARSEQFSALDSSKISSLYCFSPLFFYSLASFGAEKIFAIFPTSMFPPRSTSINTAANKSLRQVEMVPIKPATAQSVARQHATTVARKAM